MLLTGVVHFCLVMVKALMISIKSGFLSIKKARISWEIQLKNKRPINSTLQALFLIP